MKFLTLYTALDFIEARASLHYLHTNNLSHGNGHPLFGWIGGYGKLRMHLWGKVAINFFGFSENIEGKFLMTCNGNMDFFTLVTYSRI